MGELISMRQAYGEALVALGAANPDIVALSADVSNSDFSYMFQEKYPDRFFNVGIAEQALVDVAAGLAYTGKIPFANTFAFLFATRALEMVRSHLCYGQANVKLMAAYSGLSDSFDGPTHHAISDVAIMRSLPNMTVIVPGDTVAVKKMMPLVAEWKGPVYFRLNRNDVPLIYPDTFQPQIGKAVTLREGSDLTIIANGIMLKRCLRAADILAEKDGLSVRVLDMHTVKPLDQDAVMKAAVDTGAIVTVEEATTIGGLGSAVSESVSCSYPVPVIRVGIPDIFAETGPYEDLLDRYGMSIEDVLNSAYRAVSLKKPVLA